MYKHLFLLASFFVCSILSLPVYAQDSAEFGKYKNHPDYSEGFITEPDGNRIKGLIKDSRPERLYRKITFVNEEGKRKKYTPSRLESFQLGKSIYHSDGSRFLELVEEGGKVGLYRIRKKQSSNVSSSPYSYGRFGGPFHRDRVRDRVYTDDTLEIIYFVRKKGEKKFRQVEQDGFHRAFAKYFMDCPKLSDRIRYKELNHSHIKIIVQIFNNHCSS